ncbi:MAG: DUF4446 family protein [Candidatus Sungbacteria bacterium]|nr:DUF4446 family protein [Candidatus Sungbacteria bacterium]
MNYLITNPLIVLAVSVGVAFLVLAGLILNLYRRWSAVFGVRVRKASDALQDILQRTGRAEERLDAIEPRLATLESVGNIAVQKVGFMRFNPFEHTGGDQSFALALLDRESNGIILSSLYTRDGVRVYAKEVRRGTARHPLSNEEQQVLEQAINRKS